MADDITLKMIFDHQQGMRIELQQFRAELREMDQRLSQKIDLVASNRTRQIDAIDGRLDEIEIAKLPQRVTRIEEHLQLTAA